MDVTILVEELANRIGFVDRELIAKAVELYRIADIKIHMKTRGTHLTQSSKICICLDLAAECLHKSLSRKELIHASGITKNQYEHLYKTISTVLNIDNNLRINELCVKLNVCSVRELATEIYDVFCKKSDDSSDLNHPQYKVLSIFCACKLSKVKIFKSICIQQANLNIVSFNKLLDKFNTFLKENNFEKVPEEKPTGKDIEKEDIEKEDIEKILNTRKSTGILLKKVDESTVEIDQTHYEPYETWKKRIMENAYKQLEIENVDVLIP